jgi:membrane-associated protease RseP (regulator of RpoE activity)
MNGYLIALLAIALWIAMVYVLNKKKVLERHSMSPYGPFIMWKTRRGKELIDRIAARKRFWEFYGRLSLWVCAGAMALITILLLWEATIVSQIASPPSPELILGIPGLNPVIPLWYGILGLVVAIIVHELAHGILTRVGGMKIQSLGMLFLIFPMGAFVEPDDDAMKTTTRSKRAKVFAVGPATNILVALLVLAIFSGVMMSSLEADHEGALVVGVVTDSPASMAGISSSFLIVSVDGTPVTSADDLADRVAPEPGGNVSLDYYFKGQLATAEVVDGVVVAYVTDGYAGSDYGLETGMVLTKVNGTPVGNLDQLTAAMGETRAGQNVSLEVFSYDSALDRFTVDHDVTYIVLSDKYEFYQQYYPDENDPAYMDVGSFGSGFLVLGVYSSDVSYYSDVLAHPFKGDNDLGDFSKSWLRLIALPFLDMAPVRSPVTDLYSPSGALSWMPDSVFWVLGNSLYWIFWLNLMVGLTNVLPAVPLDGGYLFRDGIDYLIGRLRPGKTKEQREKVVGNVSLFLALFVLALIVWQLVGPAF